MENNNNVVIRIAILGMATFCMAICCFNVAEAADPPPLQDFCIATNDASSAGTLTMIHYIVRLLASYYIS